MRNNNRLTPHQHQQLIFFRQPVNKDGVFDYWYYWGFIPDGFAGLKNPENLFSTPLCQTKDSGRVSYQATGQLDCNGQMIFCGDLVAIQTSEDDPNSYELSAVWWEGGTSLLEADFGDFSEWSIHYVVDSPHKIKVVGHIYSTHINCPCQWDKTLQEQQAEDGEEFRCYYCYAGNPPSASGFRLQVDGSRKHILKVLTV